MTTTKATMTREWREELTWAIRRLYAREGQQAALRVLRTVEDVYGEEEAERITRDVMEG